VSRYDIQAGESEYEPGSNGLVLRNLLGITDPREMELAETRAYNLMVRASLDSFEDNQTLSAGDLNKLHRFWLGSVYSFAGEYRQVNVSKNGFAFCVAEFIPQQMEALSEIIARNMPCVEFDAPTLAKAMSEVHGEFILIHPYREGNGRLGRWLASLMALQAGFPILDFSNETRVEGRDAYFAAVRRFPTDPFFLEKWFLQVLARTSGGRDPFE
jgi:cell filamentation protein